jgi:hypothetical protein
LPRLQTFSSITCYQPSHHALDVLISTVARQWMLYRSLAHTSKTASSWSSKPLTSLRPLAFPLAPAAASSPQQPIPALSASSRRTTMSSSTQLLQSILDANETYAAAFAQSDPALLRKLAQGQSPKIFWLGCSDSRVSAELCVPYPFSDRELKVVDTLCSRSTGVAPGSIFVHVSGPLPPSSPRGIPKL